MAAAAKRPHDSRTLAKALTRERFLQIARRLFIEHGYEAISIREIAKESDYSTGAFYEGFSSKEEVLYVILEAEFQETFPELVRWSQLDLPCAEAVLGMLTEDYVRWSRKRGLLRSWRSQHCAKSLVICTHSDKVDRAMVQLLRGLLGQGCEPNTSAKAFLLWKLHTVNLEQLAILNYAPAPDDSLAAQLAIVLDS